MDKLLELCARFLHRARFHRLDFVLERSLNERLLGHAGGFSNGDAARNEANARSPCPTLGHWLRALPLHGDLSTLRGVSDSAHLRELYRRIYAVVRRIPRGAVATYGQVAELAGIPGGARVAGAAMKTSMPADKLPWQRVIGKAGKQRGRIAIHDPVGAAVQRKLLEDEGITVGETGLVALDVHGWLPTSAPRTRSAQRRRVARTRRRAHG